MTRSFVAALALMSMVSGSHAAKPQDPLKIDALLHSLLQVQDRLAAGDEAALGLQSHLMKLLAAGVEESRSPAELSDAEIEALMIFGIIGTGSKAVSSVLFDRSMPQDFADLAQAIGTYRQRKRAQALKRFSKVDQDNVQERVRPFVAFALGNLLSRRWPKAAVRHYNLVRLDAPGTLLEEATIRRLMALYGSNNQPQPFLRLAMDYAQRFIESPYRKQYLKSLRKGIVAMRRGLTDDEIVSMANLMPVPYRASFYMHLVRKSLLSGHLELASFAVDKIVEIAEANDELPIEAQQVKLLKLLSRMRDEEPKKLFAQMAMIDTRKLHVDDVTLLKTAQNILKTVIGPVDDVATQSVVPEPELKEEVENDAVSSEQTTIAIDGEKESLARIEDFISKSNERLNSIDGMLSE